MLTNEESLKGISYEKDFFENIGCSELNELTYSSQTEQAIQEKNKEYKRIFQIIIDNNNLDNLDMLIDYANDLPYVYAAEYNYYLETCASPNDTYYYEQEYYLGMEYFEETWDFVTGNNNVKVAIIDSGIDITHSDLCNRVDQNLSCSFINGYSALSPSNAHGTNIAGIIGAQGNNNNGICGTCWDVSLVSLRVMDYGTSVLLSALIEAIDYCDDNNIKIINLSISTQNYSYSLEQSISSYNGLVVCASGNDGIDIDIVGNERYPACFTSSNILCVGSLETDSIIASDSNYGLTSVDLFGFGVDIFTTNLYTNNNPYYYKKVSGTSFSAPQVAGLAALLLSHNNNLTTQQLKSAIISYCTQRTILNGKCVSGGYINAYESFLGVHTHSYSYEYYNEYYHTKTCDICESTYLAAHSWTLCHGHMNGAYLPNGPIYYMCTKCGALSPQIPPSI